MIVLPNDSTNEMATLRAQRPSPYELRVLVSEYLRTIPEHLFTRFPPAYLRILEGRRVYRVAMNSVEESGNGHTSGDRRLGDGIGFER